MFHDSITSRVTISEYLAGDENERDESTSNKDSTPLVLWLTDTKPSLTTEPPSSSPSSLSLSSASATLRVNIEPVIYLALHVEYRHTRCLHGQLTSRPPSRSTRRHLYLPTARFPLNYSACFRTSFTTVCTETFLATAIACRVVVDSGEDFESSIGARGGACPIYQVQRTSRLKNVCCKTCIVLKQSIRLLSQVSTAWRVDHLVDNQSIAV